MNRDVKFRDLVLEKCEEGVRGLAAMPTVEITVLESEFIDLKSFLICNSSADQLRARVMVRLSRKKKRARDLMGVVQSKVIPARVEAIEKLEEIVSECWKEAGKDEVSEEGGKVYECV